MKVIHKLRDRGRTKSQSLHDALERLKIARETLRARQEIIDTLRNTVDQVKTERDENKDLLEDYDLGGLSPGDQLHRARMAVVELEYDREQIAESFPESDGYILCAPTASDFEEYLRNDGDYMVWREYYYHGKMIRSKDTLSDKQIELDTILETVRRESIEADEEDDPAEVYHDAEGAEW